MLLESRDANDLYLPHDGLITSLQYEPKQTQRNLIQWMFLSQGLTVHDLCLLNDCRGVLGEHDKQSAAVYLRRAVLRTSVGAAAVK